MERKCLALVIHSLQVGGMERVMSELIRYSTKQEELDVHLILYGITREIVYEIPSNITIHQPSFIFTDYPRFLATLKTLKFFRKKIKELRPVATLSFGEFWNSFVLLATVGLYYPVFVSDRSQPNKPLGRIHDQLRRILYPRAAGVIAQTERASEIYRSMYSARRMAVIGNPIREIEPVDNPPQRENIVLMVGRLIRSKHQDELIRIFSQINLPDWRLVLVGDDHLKQKNRKKLQALIIELGMENKIELAGKRLDVEHFYLRSKVFAFTSSSEGFPNVIGEAMSAGLPVVAYDCTAGPAELIEDGRTGYLVDLHDLDTFERRLRELMQNEPKAKAMGDAGKVKIQEFSKESIGKKFLSFILNADE